MKAIVLEILIIIMLILANGVFATAEIALLSARRPRLQRLARGGDRSAAVALELSGEPDRFLSTVQIGITLIGVLTGAFGGATIAEQLDDWLEHVPGMGRYSETIAFGSVVLGITYLSLVLGELVPKRIALSSPERIATRMSPLLSGLSRLARPAVWLLNRSTRVMLWLLRVRAPREPDITGEDLRAMVRQGGAAGTISTMEQTVMERVLRLGNRPVASLMTPRTNIEWLDLDRPLEELRTSALASTHTRFLVAKTHIDQVTGVISTKGLYAAKDNAGLSSTISQPLFVVKTMPAFRLLELFRQSRIHTAVVLDEYGSVDGLVTPSDILEALVGELPQPEEAPDEPMVRREDGSWLFDGTLDLEDVKLALDVVMFEGEKKDAYQTLAGYVIAQMKKIPHTGDTLVMSGFRFEIIDMDGRRVDKILVMSVPQTPSRKR